MNRQGAKREKEHWTDWCQLRFLVALAFPLCLVSCAEIGPGDGRLAGWLARFAFVLAIATGIAAVAVSEKAQKERLDRWCGVFLTIAVMLLLVG